MKREPMSFSRQVSQFVACQVAALNKEQAEAALTDMQKIKATCQWNFVEFALKKSLIYCVEQHLMGLN